jgi:ribosome-associated protein
MPGDGWLLAGDNLRIPPGEVTYRATRGGGPGGQHVNKASTRVELWWHLDSSAAPTDAQRAILRDRLASRLDGEGWLRLVESGSRSQLLNRQSVTERFLALLARALTPRKRRKPTGIPRQERERRLQEKRERSATKRQRGRVVGDE